MLFRSGEAVAGYEMHMGVTTPTGSAVQPMLRLGSEDDGAVQGVVSGCYLHGLFNADGFRRSFLRSLDPALQSELAFDQRVEGTLDDLAAHFEEFLDLDAFYDLARAG